MKTNKLFEDVFMDIDWSLYDDETADLTGLEKKIYSDAMGYTHHPKTKSELIAAIKEEIANGNTDLNCIDTSKITSMSNLFNQGVWSNIPLSAEQQKALDVSGWDVSNVKDTYAMFWWCRNFNQDLSKWDVRNVKNMSYMFSGCTDFDQDLSKWDVSNVEGMRAMFHDCTHFNQDLSGWDVRNVRNMGYMFAGCASFNKDLSSWDVRKVERMGCMFEDCTKLEENGLIPDWYKWK